MVIYLLNNGIKNKKQIVCIVSLSLVLFLSAVMHIPNHKFEVITFDVGNADAFLLKSPENKYFIIDTGKLGYNGGRSQADILIMKYLKDKGIKDIEGLIVTHFDADHAGGAVDLINGLNIKNVYLSSLCDKKTLAQKIYNTIDSKNITNKYSGQNNKIIYSEPNFKLTTLKANLPEHGKDGESNENSIITIAESGKMKILFTGDSGVEAFNKIRGNLPKNITILKVGHHGAKNVINKEMLEYLNPDYALVSTGYNHYGHPNPLTIKLLSSTKIIRTDKIHAIKIISDGKGYEIDGYDSKKRNFYKKYSKKWD